jgi:hypothetical protein
LLLLLLLRGIGRAEPAKRRLLLGGRLLLLIPAEDAATPTERVLSRLRRLLSEQGLWRVIVVA